MDKKKVKNGWLSQKEFTYWIPDCDVEGKIPHDLQGSFIRNGPGINEVYGKKLKHPIDGDGMVCKLTLINGRAHFSSKFVQTKHRLEEETLRKFMYMGQMGTRNDNKIKDTINTTIGMLTGNLPKIKFRNPSNTNAFYWGGKIITLYETSIPYCLDPYTLESLGPEDLNGHLTLKNAAAHFRIDPLTMNLIMFSLRPGIAKKPPELEVIEFDANWNVISKTKLNIPGLNYSHDFLLFPDYYLFHMTPFVDTSASVGFKILSGLTSPGESMRYYTDKPSKFVVIPRKAQSVEEVMFIDTEPYHIYHFGTAEQVDDELHFNCVCLDEKFNMEFKGMFLSNNDVSPGQLNDVRINLKSKSCENLKIDRSSSEFPSTHPYRHGVTGTRYVYLMANDKERVPFTDVIKIDTKSLKRDIWYSNGVIGEPVFVPRHGYQSNKDGSAEDDGYVLVQLYDPEKHRTDFCILDAQNIEKGPIARMKLKHHVPYGFHGTFTPEIFLPNGPCLKSKL